MTTPWASPSRTSRWTFTEGGGRAASSKSPAATRPHSAPSSTRRGRSGFAPPPPTPAMPTLEEHRRKVGHNLRSLETIDTDEFCDWMAVVAFYTAVHLVEQLRAVVNQHSLDHAGRNRF